MQNQFKCPCEGCITLAICRHKDFYDLYRQCQMLLDIEPNYLFPHLRNHDFVKVLYAALQPTAWTYKSSPAVNYIISKKMSPEGWKLYDNKKVSM